MAELALQPLIMEGSGWADYGLVDSGHGRKLERYGPYRFIRPEGQALWSPRLAEWAADGEFVPASDEDGGGRWQFSGDVPPEGWPLAWNEVRFSAHCTPFRHLGFFPDMAPVWEWMRERLAGSFESHAGLVPAPSSSSSDAEKESWAPEQVRGDKDGGLSTLNLFGYTGVGSLALSQCGPVAHVDASKKSVAQARENAALAEMAERPIRWLVDDAAKFAAREFGRGPEGEVWRLEEGLPPLIADCRRLLDADSKFLFLTVYAVRMSSLALAGLLAEHFADLPGTIEHGDLAVREEGEDGRLLPTAIFARWRNG
jgi:23S rRNA (cytosine1962-C5)-methyltransferase